MKLRNIYKILCAGAFKTSLHRKSMRSFYLSDKDVFLKQDKALKSILNYAVKHCAFYKNTDPNCIEAFPVIEKNIIKDNPKLFISDIANRYYNVEAFTGGSTGVPFKFLRSGGYESEFQVKKWKEYGYKNGDVIFALDGTKIDDDLVANNVYWEKVSEDNLPYGSVAVSSLYLDEKNIELYIKFLITNKADFWRGYPSFINQLACYVIKKQIDFSPIKGIELTSETIYDYQLKNIKKAFNSPIYLQYGHSEAGVFAYTYDDGFRYKVEPLYGYVEVLNEENKQVDIGEIGEVVVTTLSNYAMPLIRYRTGDLAVYGGRDDRFIYFDSIIGRTQDYIVSKDNKKVLLTALIFGQHFEALGKIHKWQIEQYVPGVVIAHIIKDEAYTIRDEKEISCLFKTLGNVEVNFDYVTELPLTPRGKSKMLVQHLKV